MEPSARTRAALLDAILAHVEERAVSRPVQRPAAEGAGDEAQSGRRVDLDGVASLLDVSARLLDDDAVGLRFAAGFDLGLLGPFSYAVLRAPTFGTALRNMERYSDAVAIGTRLRLEVGAGSADVVLPPWGPGDAGAYRHLDEAAALFLVRTMRRLAGPGWSPRGVELRHAAPADVDVHRRLLGAPVAFERPESRIRCAPSDLARPVRDADRQRLPIVERHLADVVSDDAAVDPWRHDLELAIASCVCDGHPGIGTIAPRLGMSERTLQRRLGERGLCYRDLVAGVRLRIARHYLGQSELGLAEIAFLLGYSELSAFDRAFRRWTGRSPSEERRLGRAAGA